MYGAKRLPFKNSYNTLDEAQGYLQLRLAVLTGRTGSGQKQSPAAGLEQERSGLYSYPGYIKSFSGENLKVDKYATVSFVSNRYFVPDYLTGKMVFVKVYSQWIKIFELPAMP